MMPRRASMKEQMEVQAGTSLKPKYTPPSREGKVIINFAAPPEVRKQIKDIANEQDTSSQALILEAINDMFEKFGRKPIA